MPDDAPNAAPVISHAWERIEDLPENWHDLCRRDLHAVHRQWTEDRNLIKDPEKINTFRDRLHRLWAIETGIIEGLYSVDRGITLHILQAGMEALGRYHARNSLSTNARALIEDQHAALGMVMDAVGGKQELTAFYIKQLHDQLTRSQDTCDAQDQFGNLVKVELRRGAWKKHPNNPLILEGSTHEYCPPEFVQDEIDQLLAWHKEHDAVNVCPEVEAAWIHHRFTQIHPFQDGNGRVARALTGAVFLKADHLFLVIRSEKHRNLYLDALEAADGGDLSQLVDLFADIQIKDLQDAMESIRELRGETIVQATESVAERARRRKEAVRNRAAGVMDDLLRIASVRLEETVGELYHSFHDQGVEVSARVRPDDEERRDWWSWQIIDAARHHQYYAELDRPRRWVSIQLRLPEIERDETRFVVSLHAVGRAADLHAVTAFLTNPVTSGKGDEPKRWESRIVPGRPFQFRAETDKVDDISSQFRAWLETAIENGLSVWGERL